MKKLLVTTFSSLLTLSSVALAISPQANALSSNFHQENPFSTETTSPTNPQPTLSEEDSENLMASVYCETRTNGYQTASCCVDSYGNWACVWN